LFEWFWDGSSRPTPIVTGITLVFIFHICWILIVILYILESSKIIIIIIIIIIIEFLTSQLYL
jgi:hypothetical protein